MLAIVEERAELDEPRASRRSTRRDVAAGQAARLRRRPARPPLGHRRARVRAARQAAGVQPTYKTVDTCAAEFAAATPYHYSTWEDETRCSRRTGRGS